MSEKLTEVSPLGLIEVSFLLNSPTLHGIRILFYFYCLKNAAIRLVNSQVSKYSDSPH